MPSRCAFGYRKCLQEISSRKKPILLRKRKIKGKRFVEKGSDLCPVHLIFILASNIEIVVKLWMFISCLLLDKTLWILLQIVKKVYRLLRDNNSRALYDFGGCVDNDGDNVLLNIQVRRTLDRPVYLIFWFDSHGTLRHYLPIFIQQAFKGQSRY